MALLHWSIGRSSHFPGNLIVDVLLATILGTVIGTILILEANAWIPYISRRVVRRVLGDLPKELPKAQRDRWVEEVEGDLESFADRPLGGLYFALGLWLRGGKRLSGELLLQAALASGTDAGHEGAENLGSQNEGSSVPWRVIDYLDSWADRGYATHALAQFRKVQRFGWDSEHPDIAAIRRRVEDWEKLADWEKW